MKRIALLPAVILLLLNSSPAWAGPSVWNPNQTVCAYVDFLLPEEHALAAFTGDAKTIYFYNAETGERGRGTYYRFGSRLDDYSSANNLEIVCWVDNQTVLVRASFTGDWNWIEGTETFRVSINGRTEFTGFENLPRRQADIFINPDYLEDDYMYVWDCLDISREIVDFMDALCSGDGTIAESRLPDGIMDDPMVDEYGSFEDFIGCSDVIQHVMPNDEGSYDVSSVWHSYVFGYDKSGTLVMLEYNAPADL